MLDAPSVQLTDVPASTVILSNGNKQGRRKSPVKRREDGKVARGYLERGARVVTATIVKQGAESMQVLEFAWSAFLSCAVPVLEAGTL